MGHTKKSNCDVELKENRAGVTISRFSTKLRTLIAEKPDKVIYTSLKDIKNVIKKDLPAA